MIGLVAFLVFAFGWSARFLDSVQIGMTKGQVRSLVGDPPRVRTNAAGYETWDYARFWSSEAEVHFDTNGIVYSVVTD